ncbi:MAG TPA: hypothetical protein V6D06_01505 [Trichocoleus sp.]
MAAKLTKDALPPAEKWFLGLLAGAYLALFLTILLLAYTNRLPSFLGEIPYYDKIGHVVLYAVPTYLGHRLCRYRQIVCWVPLFPALFALFTVTEELGQSLSPYRTLDPTDLIASFIGIAVGWQLAERSRYRP